MAEFCSTSASAQSSPNLKTMVSTAILVQVAAVVALIAVGATLLVVRWARSPNNVRLTAEETLTQLTARLISVLATAGFVVDDSLAVIQATNSALALGLVSGRSIDNDTMRDLVRAAHDSEDVHEVSFDHDTGGGSESRFLHARAVSIGGGLVLVLVEDNSDARDFEAVRRDFIANVTHEIKTPIGAISLLSEAMEGALDDPEQMHRFADSLRREARRLSNLVTEIIQLSRVESSDVLATATPVNVSAVITDAVQRTVVIADAQNITVDVKLPEDVLVMGDGELLTVAVKNLLENALQYSDPGSKVGIGVRERKRKIDIIVSDHGVGIPLDEQGRVFERFYRVDASRDRTTGGTGLGLSLVKHIAQSHRGKVSLFSEPGVGSSFTIRLPRLVESLQEKSNE